MAIPERLHSTLQENLITILGHHESGALLSNILDPNLMEGEYRTIAERCIEYWHRYHKPPGEHTADLMADVLDDKANRRSRAVKDILHSMLQLSDSVNPDYVLQQLRVFNRMQRIKGAIIESADKINAKNEVAIEEIEEMWANLLRTQEVDFDPGIRLSDTSRVIQRINELQSEFEFGVAELDRAHITPMRGTVMTLIAPAGRGKTWALIHVGKTNLKRRKKVCHISLEMDAEFIAQRYYQSMLKLSKRAPQYDVTVLEKDGGKITGFRREIEDAEIVWDKNVMLKDDLDAYMSAMGTKVFDNLVIKRFPARRLTPAGLRAYLDTLEAVEGFVPDLVILDYPAIMKIDTANARTSLGHTFEEVRAVAVERNCAFVVAHQSSKAGEEATMVETTHVAEDWSVIATSDVVVTYSTSKREFRFGLARLFVGKGRSEKDRFAVLITQQYDIGAFCIESHYLPLSYRDTFKTFAEDNADGDDTGTDLD